MYTNAWVVIFMVMGGTMSARCPLTHGVWEPMGEFSDEFDGNRLDESKWIPRNPEWQGRQPGWFNPSNVRLSGGMLHLDAKREDLKGLPQGFHTYTTAFVRSKNEVRYGYFEIRARAMDSRASSAFWFYRITPEIWSEIDVFEIGARAKPRTYFMNTHLFHTLVETVHWDKSRTWEAPYELAKEFHAYGLEWDSEFIRWYVDGTVVREEKNTHWHQPLHLCFDSETFPDWFGLPADGELPATFSIDYCRAWRRKDGPPDDRPWAVEFSFPGRSSSSDAVYRLKTEGDGSLLVKAFGGTERPHRVRLEYENPRFFSSLGEPEFTKQLLLRDREGKFITVAIAYSRTEPWKRECRSGSPPAGYVPSPGGYYPVGVDVRPKERKPRGTVEVFEFASDDGRLVRLAVTH